MPKTLLRTKLFIPPLRPNLVSRPHLIERLNQSLQLGHKLTLISAPAGFGKTTLAGEWFDNLRQDTDKQSQVANRISWLSLDENDNDHSCFWSYFIAALNQTKGFDPPLGAGVLSIIQSPQSSPPETVLTALINEISVLPGRIIFALDDYHLIDAQLIHDALSYLLENAPPQLHLVIVSREDPLLPLARLRARGQLTELRAVDLRFTSSEAAVFLNQVMGLELSEEDIDELDTRTEGWIAGLQLAAISLQGKEDRSKLIKSFSGSHRFVLDYLIEEVLDQQPEDIQTFLLKTAVLSRLTGSLCDELTGQNNGQESLEKLENANLFVVSLDEERQWYRYHHLFADLLKQCLDQTQPEQLPILHSQASTWYEQNGFVDDAIEHAVQADDFERATHLIDEHADAIWQRGEHTRYRLWISRLPVEMVFSRPQLCIINAWDLFMNGQLEAAEGSLRAAEQALEPSIGLSTETPPIDSNRVKSIDKKKIQGRAAAIRAYMSFHQGDTRATKKYVSQALEYLPEYDLTWRSTATVALGDAYSSIGDLSAAYQARLKAMDACKAAGNAYWILIASAKLAVNTRWKGRLQQVIEICMKHSKQASENGLSHTVVAGWLFAIWGEALAELNDLDRALRKAKKGTDLTESGKELGTLGWSYHCMLRVLFSRGDLSGAAVIIQKMEDIGRELYIPPWISSRMAAWKGRILLAENKLDAASQWVNDQGLKVKDELTFQREREHIVLARVLIAQDHVDDAIYLLQRLLETTQISGHASRGIEVLILQSLASQARGDTAQAIANLERALMLAEPGGFIRVFVDEGPIVAHLLYEALSRGVKPDYVRRILAAFPVTEPVQVDLRKPQAELFEPLSEREIEVLQLIAEGLTNPEIASRLFLAPNTVKVHTRNIYGKLSVHSRMQAIARARALGILPTT